MFKKIVSSLIIISLLCIDGASCIGPKSHMACIRNPDGEENDRYGPPQWYRAPLPQTLKKTESSGFEREKTSLFPTDSTNSSNPPPSSGNAGSPGYRGQEILSFAVEKAMEDETTPSLGPLLSSIHLALKDEDNPAYKAPEEPKPFRSHAIMISSLSENEGDNLGIPLLGNGGTPPQEEPFFHEALPSPQGYSTGDEGKNDSDEQSSNADLSPSSLPQAMGASTLDDIQPAPLPQGSSQAEEDLEARRTTLPASSFVDLSEDVKQFLLYLKDRVIDGKRNKKQIVGAFAGLLTGVAVSIPLMVLFGNGLIEFLNKTYNPQPYSGSSNFLDVFVSNLISDLFSVDNGMGGEISYFFMGPTLGLDAASRADLILSQLFRSNSHLFSRQKTNSHVRTLYIAKGALYFGALVAATLPAYYCYLIKDNIDNLIDPSNESDYDGPYSNTQVNIEFGIFSFFLVLDTVLQYGHQLSGDAERRINSYFFRKMKMELPLSPAEVKRREYLRQFKNLKRIIYILDDAQLDTLYKNIFAKIKKREGSELKLEDLKIEEALCILHVLQAFHSRHRNNLESEVLNTWPSRIGFGTALISTFGRSFIFWFVMKSLIEDMEMRGYIDISEIGKQILAVVFGGIIASLVQGTIEKEAVQETFIKNKIPEATSHLPLRMGLNIWHYLLFGPFNTLPYFITGLLATESWPSWLRLVTLGPFVIADSFNNATTFNHSYEHVIDSADSAVSYIYPSSGYKKDKLLRIVRELRRLFKNLRPDVLEAVDQELQKRSTDLHMFQTSPSPETEEVPTETTSLLGPKGSIQTYDSRNSLDMEDFVDLDNMAENPPMSTIVPPRLKGKIRYKKKCWPWRKGCF